MIGYESVVVSFLTTIILILLFIRLNINKITC